VGRLACLSLPALPLQLLLRRHPEWQGRPTAVVAEDKTQGLILYVNRAAARAGVRPGWRYGAGLSLVRELRAGVVPPEALAAETARLTGRLQRLTPHVEPASFSAPRGERSAEWSAPRDPRSAVLAEPGVFWLGADGLRRVFPTLDAWGEAVLRAMQEAGFAGAVAVGFTRFGTYAAVRDPRRFAASAQRGRRGVTVFADPGAEREAARQVPLARLGLHPEARRRLEQLGIRTAGEFAALPDAGTLERFGPEVHGLHRLARGALGAAERSPRGADHTAERLSRGADNTAERVPRGADHTAERVPRGAQGEAGSGFEPALTPEPLREPAVQTILLEYPEANLEALLFLVKGRLHPLLSLLAVRRQGLAELEVRLCEEGEVSPEADSPALGGLRSAEPFAPRGTRVRPAAPTLDAALILDLVRLRLEGLTLDHGVVAIVLAARGGPAPMEQLRLFAEHPRRDLRAGDQALARLRAEFGDGAVARAVLQPGHLPEAQFAWAPVERLAFPALTPGPSPASGRGEITAPERALVRRLYPRAAALPSPERHLRDGSFVAGQVRGPIVRRLGPYPVSGAWWAREVRRDYYYAETAQGELLWLYYDRRRRRWFVQGRVE